MQGIDEPIVMDSGQIISVENWKSINKYPYLWYTTLHGKIRRRPKSKKSLIRFEIEMYQRQGFTRNEIRRLRRNENPWRPEMK